MDILPQGGGSVLRPSKQTLFESIQQGGVHGAAQGTLQTPAAASLLKAVRVGAEIGRTAHAPIQRDAASRQADDPQELAAIPQLPAGHTASQHRSLRHGPQLSWRTLASSLTPASSPAASSSLRPASSCSSSGRG